MQENLEFNPKIGEAIAIATNESRLKIIFEIKQNSHNISSLAKKLGLNVQETHRNVNKMVDSGFLIKDNNGVLSLSTLGSMATLLFPSFHVIFDNLSFFNDHTFEGISSKYLQRIGVLQNCRLVNGVVKVLENWQNMAQQSSRFMKIIAAQSPLESVEETMKKANEGVLVNLIIGGNTIFPEKYSDILKKYNVGKLELNGFFEIRMIEKVSFCLIVTDKEASISFSDSKGEVDINKTFFGTDPQFLEWCNELFENVWSGSNMSGDKFRSLMGY